MSEITEEKVKEVLKEVYDPEIPVNVVDLGLIYEISIRENNVAIKMTLTAVGCPMHTMISQNVVDAVKKIPDVKDVNVEVVWEPKWTPDKMTEEAKHKLGFE